MFTKQHYKAIAGIIDGKTCVQILSNNPMDYISKEQLVEALCNFFANDNPRFDANKFITACGQYFKAE